MTKLPDGFLWGAATAAHQIEGSPLAETSYLFELGTFVDIEPDETNTSLWYSKWRVFDRAAVLIAPGDTADGGTGTAAANRMPLAIPARVSHAHRRAAAHHDRALAGADAHADRAMARRRVRADECGGIDGADAGSGGFGTTIVCERAGHSQADCFCVG